MGEHTLVVALGTSMDWQEESDILFNFKLHKFRFTKLSSCWHKYPPHSYPPQLCLRNSPLSLGNLPYSILTPSCQCHHRWSAPHSPCPKAPLSGPCQSAGCSPCTSPEHPAPRRAQSDGQTGFLGAGRRSSSGKCHQFPPARLTGTPPTQSGWICPHIGQGRGGSGGPGGGKRWAGRWRKGKAVGPDDPSGSPERSGAGPGLHAPRREQHSPSHLPEVAAAGWWLVAWGTSGPGVGPPLPGDWTGWLLLASEDAQSWLQMHLKIKTMRLSVMWWFEMLWPCYCIVVVVVVCLMLLFSNSQQKHGSVFVFNAYSTDWAILYDLLSALWPNRTYPLQST